MQKRLARSITDLKRVTTLFLASIVQGIDKFPYGILYCAKVSLTPHPSSPSTPHPRGG